MKKTNYLEKVGTLTDLIIKLSRRTRLCRCVCGLSLIMQSIFFVELGGGAEQT